MEKLRLIEQDLRNAGFVTDFEMYSDKVIRVCIPLPKRKKNIKTALAYYGAILINIDTCECDTCGMVVERKGIIPSLEDLKHYRKKMIRAVFKIIDIISNYFKERNIKYV